MPRAVQHAPANPGCLIPLLHDALPIALVAQGDQWHERVEPGSSPGRLSLGAALSDDAAARHRTVHESTVWPSPPAGVEVPYRIFPAAQSVSQLASPSHGRLSRTRTTTLLTLCPDPPETCPVQEPNAETCCLELATCSPAVVCHRGCWRLQGQGCGWLRARQGRRGSRQ